MPMAMSREEKNRKKKKLFIFLSGHFVIFIPCLCAFDTLVLICIMQNVEEKKINKKRKRIVEELHKHFVWCSVGFSYR